MPESFEIVTLPGGIASLRSVDHDETFHPVIGPMEEARVLHVGQQRIAERAAAKREGPLVVWDVGLGAAANAIAALEAARNVELYSFDRSLDALEFAIANAGTLEYPAPWAPVLRELVDTGSATGDGWTWRMHLGDFAEVCESPAIPAPHSVFFDPYSPAANPGLWTLEVFQSIHRRTLPGEPCMFSCYSRSTAVRTSLLLAGWFVGRGNASGEKDETTIAATHLNLLTNPLDATWLGRVSRSTAPGPLTLSQSPRSKGSDIANELRSHPQFASS